MGVIVFICLLTGPHARWVKRFLPNTTNRVVFLLIVTGVLAAWIVQGIDFEKHSDRGSQYFPFTFALLCGGALYRFVHVWWIKKARSVDKES